MIKQKYFYWLSKKKINQLISKCKIENKDVPLHNTKCYTVAYLSFLSVTDDKQHVLKIVYVNCAQEMRGTD